MLTDVDKAENVSGGKWGGETADGPDSRQGLPFDKNLGREVEVPVGKKKIGKGSQRHTIIGLEVRVEVVLGGITQAPSFRLVIICRLRLVLLPKDIIIMALWRFRHITSGLVMFAVS